MSGHYVVIETYRDGGTWRYHYPNEHEAQRGMKWMQLHHSARTYELRPSDGRDRG